MLDLGVRERKAKSQWPNLVDGSFQHTSPVDPDYNCVAWAVRDKHRWWQPSDDPEHYWPANAPREETLEAYVAALATKHFATCADATLESGYEKIAIYCNEDGFQHVARQLLDGRWTSKLGEVKDIAHATLDDLTGAYYGDPVHFMRRPRAEQTTRPKRPRKRDRRRR